jgi:hypothetical protein
VFNSTKVDCLQSYLLAMMHVAEQMTRLTTLLAAYSPLAPASGTLHSLLAIAPSSHCTAVKSISLLNIEYLHSSKGVKCI